MPEQIDPQASDVVSLGLRIDEVVRVIGTRAEAARVAGTTVQHLGQLIAGKSANPSAITLGKLAAATGYSLDWMVTGSGARFRADLGVPEPRAPALDPNLCGRITDAIARAYKDAGVDLPPLELGRLAAEEHAAFAPLAETEDDQIALARMLRQKYTKRLTAESLAARKRGA